MTGQDRWVVWFLLAAVASAAPPSSPARSSEAPTPTPTEQPNGEASKPAQSSPVAAQPDPISKCDAAIRALVSRSDLDIVPSGASDVRFDASKTLVLGIPDPLETGADVVYDSTLGAFVAGMTRAGYTLDRFWLPWDEIGASDCPGVILFRGGGTMDARDWKAAIVVGESAVWGVSRPRMMAVARLIRADNAPVSIIGPFYSRSIPSYKSLTDSPLTDSRLMYCVTSGSALDSAALSQLSAELGCPWLLSHNTVATSTLKKDAIAGYLDGKYAWLIEDATTIGRNLNKQNEDAVPVFRFPQNLDTLRRTYDEEEEGSRPLASHSRYAFTDGQPRDRPHRASENHEKQRTDLLFRHTARQLAKAKIGDIVVQGSIPDDQWIAARAIRRHAADARIWLYAWDSAATHPGMDQYLSGALVLESTYPEQCVPPEWYLHRDTAKGVMAATYRTLKGFDQEYECQPSIVLGVVASGRTWAIWQAEGRALGGKHPTSFLMIWVQIGLRQAAPRRYGSLAGAFV